MDGYGFQLHRSSSKFLGPFPHTLVQGASLNSCSIIDNLTSIFLSPGKVFFLACLKKSKASSMFTQVRRCTSMENHWCRQEKEKPASRSSMVGTSLLTFALLETKQISFKSFTVKTMAAVIYPSLRQLQSGRVESKEETSSRKIIEDEQKLSNEDLQRDEECGICMENCRDVVLPNCGHSMCLSCFQDWSARSRSCPFCRNCLNRLSTRDLWILTSDTEIVDSETLAKENLLHFYLYTENLPLFQPDMNVFIPDYML